MPLHPEIIDLGPASKRALRRHHRNRMIEHGRATLIGLDPLDDYRRALLDHDHLAACSCSICGNPRKHRGERTLQEIRVAALPRRGGAGRVEDWD